MILSSSFCTLLLLNFCQRITGFCMSQGKPTLKKSILTLAVLALCNLPLVSLFKSFRSLAVADVNNRSTVASNNSSTYASNAADSITTLLRKMAAPYLCEGRPAPDGQIVSRAWINSSKSCSLLSNSSLAVEGTACSFQVRISNLPLRTSMFNPSSGRGQKGSGTTPASWPGGCCG